MRYSLSAISLIIFTSLFVNAQPLSIQWQKCLGGTLDEKAYSIKQTNRKSFILGGGAISNDGDVSGNHLVGHSDFWVVSLDSGGAIEWKKCYGGSDEEILNSLELTADKGFVATGITGSYDGDVIGMHFPADFWITKCDSSGAIEWQRCMGGSDDDLAYKILKSFDNGFLVLGWAMSNDYDVIGKHDSSVCPTCADVWLIKLDSLGATQWSKCFGGSRVDFGYSIIQTADSGFIFSAAVKSDDGDVHGLHGAINGEGNEDFWIVKLDSSGTIQWEKCFGGSEIEVPADIINTSDGGYAVIGTTSSADYDVIGQHGFPPSIDAWVIKLDINGNLQWQKCLGGSLNDIGKKIIQLPDSSFLALCYTQSNDGDLISNPPSDVDVWFVKLDLVGNIQWQQLFGGSLGDAAYDMQLTSDWGIIFTGLTNSNDGDVFGNHGGFDIWVVKLAPLPDVVKTPANFITDFSTYIDPEKNLNVLYYANGLEKFQVLLYDITGRLLIQKQIESIPGLNKNVIQANDLSNGLYLVSLSNQIGFVTKKIVRN